MLVVVELTLDTLVVDHLVYKRKESFSFFSKLKLVRMISKVTNDKTFVRKAERFGKVY